MKIEFKFNWRSVASKVVEFIVLYILSLLILFVVLTIGVSIAHADGSPDEISSYGAAIFFLVIALEFSLPLWVGWGTWAPRHTPDGKWTVGGLKQALGHYKDAQPTNIDTLTVGPECPNKKRSDQMVHLEGDQ